MNKREFDAFNKALEKYPNLAPYKAQLRKLAIPDAPGGVDVHTLGQPGIPWTFVLAHMIKSNPGLVCFPEKEAMNVGMFIIEFQKLLQVGTDYSNTFDSVDGMRLIYKEGPGECTQATYIFILENYPLVITLRDYYDHIYLDLDAWMDLPESLTDEEWSAQFNAISKAWRDAVGNEEGLSRGGHPSWRKTWCRENIKNSLEQCRRAIVAVIPFLDKNVAARKELVYNPPEGLNLVPELN